MGSAGWGLLTVDIDGTLTRGHGWKVIAETLGQRDAFARTNRRFFAREIGEDEHLRDMLSLAAGTPVAAIERALAATPRLEGIVEGVARLQAGGIRVALLSHNPPYVGEWYVRRFGFDAFAGTDGQPVVDGIVGPPGGIHADKRAGLEALSRRLGVSPRRIVHAGDGWADAAIFPLVGGGIAINSRLPEVDWAADLVLRTDDFRSVATAVERLPARVRPSAVLSEFL
ncbi:MAG TPA: HAD family hydrolase [Thermoplasmata archaeon]|nr:HAD family hydrolase [Thermoplasmata archaeon]